MVGFDYGIKPHFMVIGDIEYPSLIHTGRPHAMGYGKVPHFGLLIEPPFACLVFEDEEKGKECFQHFAKWAESPKDGDAVALSFIETDEGGYAVCVYPELDRLIDRCIPKYLRADVNPLVMAPISFPLEVEKISDHYLLFKQQTAKQPFLFCGASKTGGLFLDVAIQKREVQFHKENEIPTGSPESVYLIMKSTKKSQYKFERKPPSEPPEQIRKRRWRRLKTFLPVAIEKLGYEPDFQSSRKLLLSGGFAHWQILQAACNIVVSLRMCQKPHFGGLDQKSAQVNILGYLLETFEKPEDSLPPKKCFSIEILRKQIIADTVELLKHIGSRPKDNSSEALLNNLKKRGFLNSDE